MGLKNTLQDIVDSTILSGLGDIPTMVTFKSNSETAYNATTGVVSSTTVSHTCKCVLTKLTQRDVLDVTMIATGRKMLVPYKQLANVNVDALDDEVDVGGVTYTISAVTIDPAGALYTFILEAQGAPSINGN